MHGGRPRFDHCFHQFIGDRKSTRLNSSHTVISYAVFCLKKKNNSTLPPLRLCCYCHVDHRAPHSFPTRRSSDLSAARRAATSFSMNSRVGTTTFPPKWPHFFADES